MMVGMAWQQERGNWAHCTSRQEYTGWGARLSNLQGLPTWLSFPVKSLPPRSSTPFKTSSPAEDQVLRDMNPPKPIHIQTTQRQRLDLFVQCKMQNEYVNLFLKANTRYFLLFNPISSGEYHLHLFPETTINSMNENKCLSLWLWSF